jgi:hypothetical protein
MATHAHRVAMAATPWSICTSLPKCVRADYGSNIRFKFRTEGVSWSNHLPFALD